MLGTARPVSQPDAPAIYLDRRGIEILNAEHLNMLSCIRCGQCLTSCPTYVLTMNEAEGPRGRIAMMRAVVEGHLELTPDVVEHEQNCLVCDACTAVCPAGVHMDPLQVALRAAIDRHAPRSGPARLLRRIVFGRLFARMALFRLMVRGLGLAQRLRLDRLAGAIGLTRWLGVGGAEALLPPIPADFVVPRGEVYPAEDGTPDAPRVSFFAGCVMSTGLAEIDRATIRVLRRAGCAVVNSAGQGCCGALNAHNGDLDGARDMFRQNIAAFERDGDTPIVVNAAGCGAMLKEYGHHLRDDPGWADRARAFAARVRDVTEVLTEHPPPMRRPIAAAVTYQDACHLAHAQRITRPPRALLAAIPGIELREMAESTLCCGSAGIYNLTNPRESRQLQSRKVERALATGAAIVATANPGCLLQIQSGLIERGSSVVVRHIVELLDEASAP